MIHERVERPRWISDRVGLTRSKDTALTSARSLRAELILTRAQIKIKYLIKLDWAYNESQLCVVSCSTRSSGARACKRSANKRVQIIPSEHGDAYRARAESWPKVGSDFSPLESEFMGAAVELSQLLVSLVCVVSRKVPSISSSSSCYVDAMLEFSWHRDRERDLRHFCAGITNSDKPQSVQIEAI